MKGSVKEVYPLWSCVKNKQYPGDVLRPNTTMPRVYSDSKMIGKQEDSCRNPSHWGIWWVTVYKV